MLTPKDQQPAPPPDEFRPWYYQNWFLFPAFVMGWPNPYWIILWPLWAVLIIRSPWHSGIISGGLAWAMLLTGAFMLVRLMGSNPGFMVTMLLPGLVLTVVTQVLWTRHKRALPAALPTVVEGSTQDSPQHSPPDATGEDAARSAPAGRATPPFRSTRARRRNPRRRSSGSGRRPPRS